MKLRNGNKMKALTRNCLIALVGLVVAAPFIAIAFAMGARVSGVLTGSRDWWLIALALGGTIVSAINGWGSLNMLPNSGKRFPYRQELVRRS